MIICKGLVPLDDHLQDRILQMIIYKRSDPTDDHLQEAGPSG